MDSRERSRRLGEQALRAKYAELCFWYPQYKLEDLTNDDSPNALPLGDIDLLLNVARLQYYKDKLDMLFVVTGSTNKKGFSKVKGSLERTIKRIKAQI